jgi:hypothetical protein
LHSQQVWPAIHEQPSPIPRHVPPFNLRGQTTSTKPIGRFDSPQSPRDPALSTNARLLRGYTRTDALAAFQQQRRRRRAQPEEDTTSDQRVFERDRLATHNVLVAQWVEGLEQRSVRGFALRFMLLLQSLNFGRQSGEGFLQLKGRISLIVRLRNERRAERTLCFISRLDSATMGSADSGLSS